MATRMDEKDRQPTTAVGLDVYSADGQLVGRVAGYIAQVPEDEGEFQRVNVDITTATGELVGSRHVLIEARGYPAQVEMTVPEEQLSVDASGRRVTLNKTMDQIRDPRYREMSRPGDS